MSFALRPVYDSTSRSVQVFLATRDFLSRNRVAEEFGSDAIAELLYLERYLPFEPRVFEVEIALEALRVDGEMLA